MEDYYFLLKFFLNNFLHSKIYCFQLSNLYNYLFLKNIYLKLSYHELFQDTLFSKEFKGF
jgi:hypothetical protein